MSEYKPYSTPTAPPYGGSQGYGGQGYGTQGYSSDPYGRQQSISSSTQGYSSDPYGRQQSTVPPAQYGRQQSTASPAQYGNSTPGSNYGGYGQHQQQQQQGYGATGYPPPASSYGAPPTSSSMFPPNTDRAIIQIFQQADVDRSGTIDANELGRLLSEGRVAFSPRTVRLMLHLFADNPSDPTRIGPTGFVNLWRELGVWHEKFMEYDRDRSGTIDVRELQQVLLSFHFAIPPSVLEMLVRKYDISGYARGIGYGQFIECGFIVKGLTEKFRDQDRARNGSATFDYTSFMLMVIPFIAA
ncbi:hypothetical protein M758_5G053000 [Ceratodon purpureus]|nr:hypothetical protein M758_5G053000 [Ceratodon purpureus]